MTVNIFVHLLIHHVAVITADIDRFIEFYTDVFEMPVIFQETTPAFRHALLRVGQQSVLHAVEMPDNIHSIGQPHRFTGTDSSSIY
ncbi:MAG: VOC family protein [Cyanomargarita calcarea GSE-NOS-MK-12-04C]|jgi:catechol 2,3-dioxygenase-like lactoylglutathione lyase family enzyme|uniref:VOC family protein n=1 Tax=Cyanomargarita calcarea GSE-NOS-MK-12-04C TaxID=2839659 RepID=A0A951QPD7_9CYAN|nr:VOC family protein [Cyanomargarita calcarea GSE-NOS-MK-12-04C]